MAFKKKVQINYKSGKSIVVKVKTLTVSRNHEGNITQISWDGMKPKPLHLGINEIESVFLL